MSKILQAVRGMNDILPDKTVYWQRLESILQKVSYSYGYQEDSRFPLLLNKLRYLPARLVKPPISSKKKCTLSPIETVIAYRCGLKARPVVRAAIQAGLLYHQIQRFWYLGPMYRHERPQKGRYRQFYQFGLEAYGMPGPDIDAEVILISARLLKEFEIFSRCGTPN